MNTRITRLLLVIATACLLAPAIAHAYIGPGTGLSAIGSFLALLAAILFAIVGFLWFPIKRMLRNRKKGKNAETETQAED